MVVDWLSFLNGVCIGAGLMCLVLGLLERNRP